MKSTGMAMEKTFNAAEAESRIYDMWDCAGCFKAGANASRKETYCIMIPPPNVTGSLHMGHAFNNTLQDILIRWHRMQGFDTLWQPGTDHAGIATQMVVERKLAEEGGEHRQDMGREKFLENVWNWKEESGGTIINQLKRLGASCDWSREAFTMSGNFPDAVIQVFVKLYNKGLIYRGKRLVNWDPKFETAISDLEVENLEVAGHMWHFKYPLAGGETYTYVEKDADGTILIQEERDYISIATTRPETMLGDGAVAVHPSDRRYSPIVGKLCEIPVGPKEHRRMIPIVTDEYPDPDFGSGAVKITGAHDFNDYQVAKRGGIPMYRLMDVKGNMRNDGLPYAEAANMARQILDGKKIDDYEIDNLINLVPDHLRGMDRFEARKAVVAEITSEGLAIMTSPDDARLGQSNDRASDSDHTETHVPLVESKPIMQPFGDRSKVVIEPMLTSQWFVDTRKIVGPAIKAAKNGAVEIMPESGEKTYFHWLENIEPWCISRQLWWGHQIPVWYGKPITTERGRLLADNNHHEIAQAAESGRNIDELTTLSDDSEIDREYGVQEGILRFCATTEDQAVAQYRKYLEAKFNYLEIENSNIEINLKSHLANADELLELGQLPLERDADVLDTWFSSGLWPIGTLGWPEDTPELKRYFPTSVLITGQDILFFWVARMMMMQMAVLPESLPVEKRIPFHDVYLHGLVRDAKGRKMSKSTGNVIDPLEIIDQYGADALRFANAAMASLGGVLKLDMERIKGYRNFGTKLWNAVRFAEMNGGFGSDGSIPKPHATVNRWIVGETAKTRVAVDSALKLYRFNDAANALYAFVWGVVCDWYLEFSKPLLLDGNDATIRETQETMGWVVDQCLILLHPIMPFITEELWQTAGNRSTMLIHADWPTYGEELIDIAADMEMGWATTLIERIRSARSQVHVPAGLHVPVLSEGLDEKGRAAWDRNEAMIRKLARIGSIKWVGVYPKGCIAIPVEGGSFGLPLADMIDVGKEKTRLENTLRKLQKEIVGLKGKLDNPRFVEKAPGEIVEEARENLSARMEEECKIRTALDRLGELT